MLGGGYNLAGESYSTVGGGVYDSANGAAATVAGGFNNTASGNFAMIPGGDHNDAIGNYSFAGGRRAIARGEGSFVWADATDEDFDVGATNQFRIRASGGVGIGTHFVNGWKLFVGGTTRIEIPTGSPNALSIYCPEFQNGFFSSWQTSSDLTVAGTMQYLGIGSNSDPDCKYIECQRSGGDVDFVVYGDGDVNADGVISGGGADLAEIVPVSARVHSVSPGDVMAIDPDNPQSLVLSSTPRSTLVSGVYSTRPGFVASEHDWDQVALDRGLVRLASADSEQVRLPALDVAKEIGEIPLAVVGIVPCKVSAENGPIHPGNLLVTSSTPGRAMRDDHPAVGTVLGKAMGSLETGTGTIDVLVTLQ